MEELEEIDKLLLGEQKEKSMVEDEDFKLKKEEFMVNGEDLRLRGMKMMKIKNLNFLADINFKK